MWQPEHGSQKKINQHVAAHHLGRTGNWSVRKSFSLQRRRRTTTCASSLHIMAIAFADRGFRPARWLCTILAGQPRTNRYCSGCRATGIFRRLCVGGCSKVLVSFSRRPVSFWRCPPAPAQCFVGCDQITTEHSLLAFDGELAWALARILMTSHNLASQVSMGPSFLCASPLPCRGCCSQPRSNLGSVAAQCISH